MRVPYHNQVTFAALVAAFVLSGCSAGNQDQNTKSYYPSAMEKTVSECNPHDAKKLSPGSYQLTDSGSAGAKCVMEKLNVQKHHIQFAQANKVKDIIESGQVYITTSGRQDQGITITDTSRDSRGSYPDWPTDHQDNTSLIDTSLLGEAQQCGVEASLRDKNRAINMVKDGLEGTPSYTEEQKNCLMYVTEVPSRIKSAIENTTPEDGARDDSWGNYRIDWFVKKNNGLSFVLSKLPQQETQK